MSTVTFAFDVFAPYRFGFFERGIVAATLAGALCGVLGVYVVLRGMSYIGHGLSHAVFGGAAASAAVQQIAPTVFGVPVVVPPPGEYVADGAARQAAWVLRGEFPRWPLDAEPVEHTAPPAPHVRERYATARSHWLERDAS